MKPLSIAGMQGWLGGNKREKKTISILPSSVVLMFGLPWDVQLLPGKNCDSAMLNALHNNQRAKTSNS